MSKYEFLIVAIVVVDTFQYAGALKCWRCISDASNPLFCADPFDESIITEERRPWTYVECSNPPERNLSNNDVQLRAVCKKVKDLINNQTIVTRSCLWEDVNASPDSCLQSPAPPYVETVYCRTCTTDGCNGASLDTPLETPIEKP